MSSGGTFFERVKALFTQLGDYVLSVAVIAHLIRAYQRFEDRMGNQFGAAITYFSFLSMIPILMVAFALAGYFLAGHPEMMEQISAAIVGAVANENLALSLQSTIDTAIQQRQVVGLTGLGLALYSGISWMGNLRKAVRAQMRDVWERMPDEKDIFLLQQGKDLVALVGLLLALVFSILMTSIAGSAQASIVNLLQLDQVEWLRPVLTGVGFGISILSNYLMFFWLYWALPKRRFDKKPLFLGTLLASIGFEVIKLLLTYLLPNIASSPTGAAFGSIIGLMFFFFLYARLILFCAAWIATYHPEDEVPDN